MSVCINFAEAELGNRVVAKEVFQSQHYDDKAAMYAAMKEVFMRQWPGMKATDAEVFQAFFATRQAMVLAVFSEGDPKALIITKNGDGSVVQTPENEVPKIPLTGTQAQLEYVSPGSCMHHLRLKNEDPMAVAASKIGKIAAIIEVRHCRECVGAPFKINAILRLDSAITDNFLKAWQAPMTLLSVQAAFH